MEDSPTSTRSSLAVGDAVFPLARDQDLDALKGQIDDAVHRGGGFIEITVHGGHVSIYLTGTQTVTLSLSTVTDAGDFLEIIEALDDPYEQSP